MVNLDLKSINIFFWTTGSRIFISNAEREKPLEVRLQLAKLLLSRLSNLLMVGLACLVCGVFSYTRQSDIGILLLSILGAAMTLMRCRQIKIFKFKIAQGEEFNPDTWVTVYGVLCLASAACWGVISFLCEAFSHDPVMYTVAVVCNTATVGAGSVRNAAAPRIANLQLFACLVPVMIGAPFTDDKGYLFLLVIIPILIIGLRVLISQTYDQLVGLYTSEHKLLGLANTDYLTQIPNRRFFHECCTALMAKWISDQRPFTILMADVDHFKSYNDLYGHIKGDECLQAIARILQSGLRETDSVISRYGGEEFIVLLRDADKGHALLVAQRLCKLVQEANILHENRPDEFDVVTISVGVADSNKMKTLEYQSIINQADQALYEAKNHGRNRVYTSKN
jgi:diguanylate cyclase (GGDEF)-like protein